MHEYLLVAVLGLMVIAACSVLGEKLRIATPLLLLAVGIGVSLLPFTPTVAISPEWILAGILPPLLYSASVSMPVMDFRREFSAIGGLSVALVVISAVLLGLLFWWLIPGVTLAWGIALGAIVSPTDAVATGIVKRVGVSSRVVSILEGESLLNDATALVLLRSAIAAAAASVSVWGVVGDFAFAVVVAVAIGAVVGKLNLWVRSRVTDATVNTVLSFTVPFVASIPAELLGASGLVAAVVAGLVTGTGGAAVLSPRHRLSDAQNWSMVELVLEGAVFLIMGLELTTVVEALQRDHDGSVLPVLIVASVLALAAALVIRTGFVAPLLLLSSRSARRRLRAKPRLESMQERLDNAEDEKDYLQGMLEDAEQAELDSPARARWLGRWRLRLFRERAARAAAPAGRPQSRTERPGTLERLRRRLRRFAADIEYFQAEALGWREGTVVVWAGMRGAVTLAAAQTLPHDTPNRSLLVLIAFVVAAGSLVVQGGSLAFVVSRIKPARADTAAETAERERLMETLREAARSVEIPDEVLDAKRAAEGGHPVDAGAMLAGGDVRAHGDAVKSHRMAVIRVQRDALLSARADGIFSSAALSSALAVLDADQISLELRGDPDAE